MRRDLSNINKKLQQAAGSSASDDQLKQFAKLANKYKNKNVEDIKEEMDHLIQGFSAKEKKDLIQKLQMLRQMGGLIDNEQRKKIDYFIEILSK